MKSEATSRNIAICKSEQRIAATEQALFDCLNRLIEDDGELNYHETNAAFLNVMTRLNAKQMEEERRG